MTTTLSTLPIPVILDTDIGSDIDDTWALAMMLKSPELDVKLITSATYDTRYRAKLIAKFLEAAQRTDIPIGIGIPLLREDQPDQNHTTRRQKDWVEGYALSQYPGIVHTDGVDALIRTIMASEEIITLIAIGPLTNIAAALVREPAIAPKCRFVAMAGSIYQGYTKKEPVAEYNIVSDVCAAQLVFNVPWREMIITPTDSSELVSLRGEHYQAIERSTDPALRALIENYHTWIRHDKTPGNVPPQASSALFDTVAIYLAFSTELLVMERMGISIRSDGYTVPDPTAPQVDVAIGWKDLPAFEEFLTQRLLS